MLKTLSNTIRQYFRSKNQLDVSNLFETSKKLKAKYTNENETIGETFCKKYPEYNAIQKVINKPANQLKEFQTNLNLTKPLIKSNYIQVIENYANQQCKTVNQYQLEKQWTHKSKFIVKKLLKQFEGQYEDEPVSIFKSKILPKLNQKLDNLANDSKFENNKTILQYQNRINDLQKLSDEKLSLQIIYKGYNQTLLTLANNNFNQSDFIRMWNQELLKTFKSIDNFKIKLLLIAFNIELSNSQPWINHKLNDGIDCFYTTHKLIEELKHTPKYQKDLQLITNNFYICYNHADKNLGDYGLIIHGSINNEPFEYNVFQDGLNWLNLDIQKYLTQNPI